MLLIKDLSKIPREEQDNLLQLATAYYRMDQLVETFRSSQEQARACMRSLDALPFAAQLPQAEALLHEMDDLVATYGKHAAGYFEKFQQAAFARLETDLGLKDIRGEYIQVTRHLDNGGTRKLPAFRYARIDLVPEQFQPAIRFVLHVSDDERFSAVPEPGAKVGKDHRSHTYREHPFDKETWSAQFV